MPRDFLKDAKDEYDVVICAIASGLGMANRRTLRGASP
jgi:hypothetical protein